MNVEDRPRILHLVHQYPPDYLGGTELYTQTVAQALSARNYPVSIFTRRTGAGAGGEDRLEADVAVHLAWNGPLDPTRRFLATFGNADLEDAFERVLARFRPDLVHIQHLMGLPTSLVDRLERRRIPFVVTLHDFWWVCANAQLITNYSGEICDGPAWWLNCARCVLARSQWGALWPAVPVLAAVLAHRGTTLNTLLDRAARLIAPSRFVKQWYVEHGVSAERIRVLAHGIEPPAHTCPTAARGVDIRFGRADDSARHGFNPGLGSTNDTSRAPRRFLYAGGLAWQKGVHVLIEAFAQVAQHRPPARGEPCELWIAGDESFDPAYSERLRALTAQDPDHRICFLGKLSREEMWQTLAQVDVVVVPALWYETFSLIIHEAFAAGVPVVASQLGALAEAVHHEVDGLLVAPGDVAAWAQALQRLIDEPHLADRLREGVRPPMSLDAHVAQLRRIYREAIDTYAR